MAVEKDTIFRASKPPEICDSLAAHQIPVALNLGGVLSPAKDSRDPKRQTLPSQTDKGGFWRFSTILFSGVAFNETNGDFIE